MRIEHIEAKEKMNQDKPAESVRTIMDQLRSAGPYANSVLADRVEQVNVERLASEGRASA